jgi:hypothetical protein
MSKIPRGLEKLLTCTFIVMTNNLFKVLDQCASLLTKEELRRYEVVMTELIL